MQLTSWGRYPRVEAEILQPAHSAALQQMLARPGADAPLIPRGAGRSYGDSSLAARVLSSRYLDAFMELEADGRRLRCGAGTSLDDILKLIVPRGLFLPVVSGTRYVSVGGAIAADIHGKNHHRDGSFCDWIESFNLVLASGETVSCSPSHNAELFHASCGGMGLTGFILDATLKLEAIGSSYLLSRSLPAEGLQQCLQLLQQHNDSRYSVAWIDCLAQGSKLGRGIVHLADQQLREN